MSTNIFIADDGSVVVDGTVVKGAGTGPAPSPTPTPTPTPAPTPAPAPAPPQPGDIVVNWPLVAGGMNQVIRIVGPAPVGVSFVVPAEATSDLTHMGFIHVEAVGGTPVIGRDFEIFVNGGSAYNANGMSDSGPSGNFTLNNPNYKTLGADFNVGNLSVVRTVIGTPGGDEGVNYSVYFQLNTPGAY